MARASDNVFPRFLISEGGSTTTPAAGRVTVYAKADGLVYQKDDAGVETLMASGAAGSVATDAIWDAAGDLAVGTGANTAAKLTIGAAGTLPIVSAGTLAYAKAPTFHGCKAFSAATQAVASGGGADLTMASESYDTDTYHDLVTNNARITIPTGLGGYYVFTGYIFVSAAPNPVQTGVAYFRFMKNGVAFSPQLALHEIRASENWGFDIVSAPISLVATDYVTLNFYNALGASITLGDTTNAEQQCFISCQLVGV